MTGDALCDVGESLRTSTATIEHKTLAIAQLMQMAGDLTKGAITSLRADLLYATAALSRQLLEIRDIAVYFNIKPERAEFWLNATDEEIKNAADFKPARLRRAAGAADAIYSHHCSIGGHPRSNGAILLPGSRWRQDDGAFSIPGPSGPLIVDPRNTLAVDLLQHIHPLLLAFFEGLELAEIERYEDQFRPVALEIKRWIDEDPYAWISLPPSES
jgi:hypothetical protein